MIGRRPVMPLGIGRATEAPDVHPGLRCRRWLGLIAAAVVFLAWNATAARADPSQADVFRSIQSSVGNRDSVSGTSVVATLAVVGAVVIVAVVWTHRQNRRAFVNGGWGSATSGAIGGGGGRSRQASDPTNNPKKLIKELMNEAGLTRAQVRQLEALNDRLAADDRSVQHLATLLLCPSLIASARPPTIVRPD